MGKFVRYKGEKGLRLRTNTTTKEFVLGEVYEVIGEQVTEGKTEYVMPVSQFAVSSEDFEEVNVFFALSATVPVVGKRCICTKVAIVDGKVCFDGWSTSPVKKIVHMGSDLYQVTTHNNIYIILVG